MFFSSFYNSNQNNIAITYFALQEP